MLTDVRDAIRRIVRAPISATAAAATLALALGVCATAFALVDATLLAALPFESPEALVHLGEAPLEERDATPRPVSVPTFDDWRQAGVGVLSRLEAFDPTNVTVTGLGAADRVGGTLVTAGFLDMLGVRPTLGRLFRAADRNTSEAIVLVSDGFWRSRLAADPSAIGRSVTINGVPHAVAGVLPPSVRFALDADLWMVFRPDAGTQLQRGRRMLRGIGRLRDGITAAQAATVLDRISAASIPASRAVVRPLQTAVAGAAARPLGLLLIASACALAIALANLASLLIVRASDRRQDLAVRAALGASTARLVRSSLLESILIVGSGAVCGILLALWLAPIAGRMLAEQLGSAIPDQLTIGWRTPALMAIAAVIASALCAIAPSFAAIRIGRTAFLDRGGTLPRNQAIGRRVLIVGEVGISFALLGALMLVGTSFQKLVAVDPGFAATHTLSMRLSLPAPAYPDEASVAAFYDALRVRLSQSLAADVAVVDEVPLTGDGGRAEAGLPGASLAVDAVVRSASPRYFEVMGIPVLAGHGFDPGDTARSPARAVISRAFARRALGADDAVGRRLWIGRRDAFAEVIGVVGDVKHRALDETDVPTIYVAAAQAPSRSSHVLVRSARPARDVVQAVRAEVARLDADLPVYAVRPLADVLRSSPGVATRRLLTATFATAAMLALALAAIGLFGLMSHLVSARRRELALRIALGASPQGLQRAVLRQTLALAAFGSGLGLVLMLALDRAIRPLLVGVATLDLPVLATVALLVAGVAALAGLSPARRAAAADPASMLRGE